MTRSVANTLGLALGLAGLLAPPPALAAPNAEEKVVDDAQMLELESLRAQIAGQIQLQAFDLLDELVFDWTQHPLFSTETPLVLADVSVPLGLGSGMQALVENHFASLIIANPAARLALIHCPQCTAVIVHSSPKGTVVSRGVDAPEVLEQAGGAGDSRHAIFLDFEAEGSELVLRARITRLNRDLNIVFARTLSSSIASPALLRSPERLVSAEQARKEYLDALENRMVFDVPLRIGVRSYAVKTDTSGMGGAGLSGPMAVPPFVWLEAGVEIGFSQARAWTAGLTLGYTWAPELHDGWLAQVRMARLLSGKARSLTRPDVYLFIGGSITTIYGGDALLFRTDPVDVGQIIAAMQAKKQQTTFAAWQIGLDLRVKNRIGLSVFLESLPTLGDAPSLNSYLDLGIAKFESFGVEVSFCF